LDYVEDNLRRLQRVDLENLYKYLLVIIYHRLSTVKNLSIKCLLVKFY